MREMLDKLDRLDKLDKLDKLDRLDRLDKLDKLDRLDKLDENALPSPFGGRIGEGAPNTKQAQRPNTKRDLLFNSLRQFT